MAEVDAVNDRLNGLVTLLQAVGVGGDDVDRIGKQFGNADMGMPDTRQLNDEQVADLIRKLQIAQSEAPQIIAALSEGRSVKSGGRQQQPQHEEEEEDDDEDDDEFDENANYPMVGGGCSDDISVVSDLTTPTCVTGVPVAEEEHYRETLPPMVIGGGPGEAPPMVVQPSKRKNLVNQVRGPSGGSGIAPPRRNVPAPRAGGAAASRRKNYQETMAKLHENPHSMGYAGPNGAPRKTPSRNKSTGSGAPPGQKKRTPRASAEAVGHFSELASSKSSGNGNSWESPSNWNAFDGNAGGPKTAPRQNRRSSTASGSSGRKKTTSVDNNGFLAGDGFDPFNTSSAEKNPFKSGNANKDPAFNRSFQSVGNKPFQSGDGFDAFGTRQPTGRKPRPKRPDGGAASGQPRAGGQAAAPRPKGQASQGRPRRARRASLAM